MIRVRRYVRRAPRPGEKLPWGEDFPDKVWHVQIKVGSADWSMHSSNWASKEVAEDATATWAKEHPDVFYRVVEGTWMVEEGETKRHAHDIAAEEVLADARGRCTVPVWAFDGCMRIQQWVMEEVELQVMNDEDLYTNGPRSSKFDRMLRDTARFAYDNWVVPTFHPNAEEEMKKMHTVEIEETDPKKVVEQKAKGLANRLIVPFLEQYLEIPKRERVSAVRETNRAVLRLLHDYKDSLRANWAKRRP